MKKTKNIELLNNHNKQKKAYQYKLKIELESLKKE